MKKSPILYSLSAIGFIVSIAVIFILIKIN